MGFFKKRDRAARRRWRRKRRRQAKARETRRLRWMDAFHARELHVEREEAERLLLRGPRQNDYRTRRATDAIWRKRVAELTEGEFLLRYKFTKADFAEIVARIAPHVKARHNPITASAKVAEWHSKPLEPDEKLAISLRYAPPPSLSPGCSNSCPHTPRR